MPRNASPEQKKAKHLYLESNGQMLLKDIAEAVGKSAEQIRKWKSTGKWDAEVKGNVTKSKSNVTKREKASKSIERPESINDEDDTESVELTEKQRRFVSEYLVDGNATQAAIRAGYSERNADKIGPELLGKTRVQEALSISRQALQDRVQLTQEWVLNGFKEVFERCMQQEAVTDREGNPIGEYRFEHAGANKALENIGKILGFYTDKISLSGEVTTKNEQHYHITQRIIEEDPTLVDKIFGRGMADRSGQS